AGVGAFGRRALERARRLAELGFAPPAHEVADGFLVTTWVAGRPLSPGDADGALLDRMGGYVAALAREFPSGETVDFDGMMEMVRVNVREGLGEAWEARTDGLERLRDAVAGRETVGVDGRMLPHEWIVTGDGYLKTDGVDHHDDHFFPGRQDAAWDLAGAIVEFELDDQAARQLVDRYAALSGDREVVHRMPFNLVAYLAYRLGYATLSADSLGGAPDAARLRALAGRYAARLKREIEAATRSPRVI
ncbi:MAG TPA: hypothetical protein VFQ39_09465, partial [Longimicrobium sp.]|nr:hypothetical protein [Longimicrobium sp.]